MTFDLASYASSETLLPYNSRVGFPPAKTCFCHTWGFNWFKPVETGLNRKKKQNTSTNVSSPWRQQDFPCISYKANTVTHLCKCTLNHTSCCLKCASTQMKTAPRGQDKIMKVHIIERTGNSQETKV